MGYRGKRLLDLVVSLTVLAVCSPLLLLISLLVAWRMGRPVLFRQTRPGRDARPFSILKFRTMRDAVDVDGRPLPDRERLTSLGRFLRASSLDELPGLWNVVRGEMSLVGPRPLLVEYAPYYTERERLRFTVRPGVTGWAQVNGRNELPWNERLEHDVWYVEHCSFWLDLKILGMTAIKVLRRSGVRVDTTDQLTLSEERRREVPSLTQSVLKNSAE